MNVDELLEQYMNEPKWKGKLFMDDEKTCYTDGLLIGFFLAQTEHVLLKQQICVLQSEISRLKEQNASLANTIAVADV